MLSVPMSITDESSPLDNSKLHFGDVQPFLLSLIFFVVVCFRLIAAPETVLFQCRLIQPSMPSCSLVDTRLSYLLSQCSVSVVLSALGEDSCSLKAYFTELKILLTFYTMFGFSIFLDLNVLFILNRNGLKLNYRYT